MTKQIFAALLLLMNSSWVTAHHGVVNYDLNTEIVHENVTVLEWRFVNPHVQLVFEAPNTLGELVKWTSLNNNANRLARTGYSAETFRPGDVVTVYGYPNRDGRPDMAIRQIIRNDGSIVNFRERAAGSLPPAPIVGSYDDDRDFSGVWEAINGPISSEVLDALVPADAFFWATFGQAPETAVGETRGLPLTNKGQEILANWNPGNDVCRPTSGWMAQSAPGLHEIEKRLGARYHVRTESLDHERTIWLDGRGHPPLDITPRTFQGHSSGHWEGNALVVETVNMLPNQITRNGIYHSDQAVMTERLYREGDVLTWLRVINDPEHFTQRIASVLRFKRSPYSEVPAFGECTRPGN